MHHHKTLTPKTMGTAMDPCEFFDEEYNNLQLAIQNLDQLTVQSKEFYSTIIEFQKTLKQILVLSSESTKIEKLTASVDILDKLLQNVKQLLVTSEQTQTYINKVKND